MFEKIVEFIRTIYDEPEGFIPLHQPQFNGNEKKYVLNTIESTFVSSVGEYVDRFEEIIKDYTSSSYAVATVNGTSALHIALKLAGVEKNELVITQPLSFIATCNSISYCNAEPLFIDIEKGTLGLSPDKLKAYLISNVVIKNKKAFHRLTGQRIGACVPMHTYGHPARIDAIIDICNEFGIPVVEDAAESLGSKFKDKYTGTFGLLGTFSFNGNKIITSGGGGMIITNNETLGKTAKHLTTQAKVPHPWEFKHDQIGYNYRLPNVNAALACAQMEMLPIFLDDKRFVALEYATFFNELGVEFVNEPANTRSNYWLNSILLENKIERDAFLLYTNNRGIMTRPAWALLHELPMFKSCLHDDLFNAVEIASRLVNIPSSPRKNV